MSEIDPTKELPVISATVTSDLSRPPLVFLISTFNSLPFSKPIKTDASTTKSSPFSEAAVPSNGRGFMAEILLSSSE